MAELNARIIAKASATAAEEPQASDLEVAELAVNTADGKLFTKHTDGSVVTISGGGAVDSVNGETGVVVLGLDDLDDTYTIDTGERYYNEGTHPTGAETETGNYSIYEYTSSNKGLVLYRTDANGDDFDAMFPDGFTFGNGGTSGSLRVSSTSGSGYTDYIFNYVSNSASSGSMTPAVTWVKFNMDNRTIVPTGQGSLYFTTTVTVPSTGPADGQVLTWVDANSQWEPATPGGRTTPGATTSIIADGASENVTVSSTGKSGQLLAIETDQAAWVTLYVSQAARTSDSGRSETTDPAPGSGVIAEVITSGSERVSITPCINYFNDETTPVSELYLKVVNKSGSTQAINVTLTVSAVEA